jgi:tyrosyl-tRNA synthetase
MFRKIMQIDDDVIFRFFQLLSPRAPDEVAALKSAKAAGRNPMEIKAIFARETVERFHDADAATRAAREFERVYAKDAVPEDVALVELAPEGGVAELAWALKQANLVPSTSEARRLIEQGGVEIDGQRATDAKMRLLPGSEHLVRVGSKNRRFARIRIAG